MIKWMGVQQIAVHLGVSKESVYRWLEAKKIPAHRVGKLWKFDPVEVDQAVMKGDLKWSQRQRKTST
jgi:excisionase family DNA binding protein